MYLTRHATSVGPRWATDGHFLPQHMRLAMLLELPAEAIEAVLRAAATSEPARGELLAPIEPEHEVWACGVTYLRSREARVVESQVKDVYEKVYDAERVEIFFKATGARVVGHGQTIRIRSDSHWDVPEPELTLVINRHGDTVGYAVGNDMSSRDIEGENPLYLPQAKIYRGSCALGPGIVLAGPDEQRRLRISLRISRNEQTVFDGETDTGQLKRSLEEMAGWLYRELDFPGGAFLMTGAGIVPPDDFTLEAGDRVTVKIADLELENTVTH